MSEPLPDEPSLISRYRWRVRLGTALTIAVIGTTLGVTWYAFVRAPGPRSVCDHVSRMRRAFPDEARRIEAALTPMREDGPGASPSADQRCMWYFGAEQKALGFVDYGRRSRCVTSAEDPRELLACL